VFVWSIMRAFESSRKVPLSPQKEPLSFSEPSSSCKLHQRWLVGKGIEQSTEKTTKDYRENNQRTDWCEQVE